MGHLERVCLSKPGKSRSFFGGPDISFQQIFLPSCMLDGETLVELELYAGVLTRPRHYRFNTRACATNPHCNTSIVWEV